MTEPLPRLAAAIADRYRIERELGAGGMATVYVAQDLKHDRQVAVKVLRPELAAVIGADRFLSEIKTTANLQHPHILPLFDSGRTGGQADGRADDFLFYVMPLIEGESLRDRLAREKQLPIADAVRIATEVAGALDYAHRHGVIHRDIKPENVLLHDGRALVADFGIALAASKAGGSRMTETGMSLGTPTYMSPEQAMGEREITARSDVYALGCMLYEMLVGEPPFTGPTAQAIVAKVMTDEPRPPSQLRKSVPPHVDAAVLTALAKLPADRFATAAAFGEALENRGYTSPGMSPAAPSAAAGRAGLRRVLGVAAWVGVGAIGALLAIRGWRPPAASTGEARLQVTYSGRAGSPAISPDGRFVAYLERRCPEPPARGGCLNLHVLEVGTTRPVEIITGANRLATPRWTHDGLGLVVGGDLGAGRRGLFLVPRLGGTPRRITDEPSAYDTHPSADSVAIVINRDSGATLRVVEIASGRSAGEDGRLPGALVDLSWAPDGNMFAASDFDHVWVLRRDGSVLAQSEQPGLRGPVRWSFDSRNILTFRWGAGQEDDLVALPVGSGSRLLDSPHVVASQVRTMYQGAFDVARSTGRIVLGSGTEISDLWSFDIGERGVQARRLTQGSNWYGPPFLTSDGRTIYYLRADPLGNNLYSMADGRETALTAERQFVNSAGRLSTDERLIAFEALNPGTFLALYDVSSGTSRRLTRGSGQAGWAIRPGGNVVWMDTRAGSVWITDSVGGTRRALAIPALGTLTMDGGGWLLDPHGETVAILGRSSGEFRLVRVPLGGGDPAMLARVPADEGMLGLAGWLQDGSIYLARSDPSREGISLLRFDPSTRAVHPYADLPVHCDPRAVTVAAAGRKAACGIRDQRGDLWVIDGLKP